jgi:tetratricopeptide (TPR) repeat protein
MKLFLILPLLLLFLFPVFAQDINAIVKEADRLEDIPNEMAALQKFKEALKIQPTHVHALSKSSELCSRIGSRETNAANRDAWFKAALAYANKAISVAPLNDQANVSMAMILGKSTLTKSGKEKLKNARLIRKHLETALKTNPNNYLAWHILGRWNYEISNVSAVERAGAKIFYGGVPSGSIKNAIMYFEKSRSLMPQFVLNYLSLANAYHKDGQVTKAVSLLKTVQSFPVNTEDDAQHKADALKMIKAWE